MKVTPVFLRTEHNYDRDAASEASGLKCLDKSLTQQQFLEECDINTIVKRFGLTGEMPGAVRAPGYGDFSQVKDFRQALDLVRAGEEAFMQYPAELRARFENDPGKFLAFFELDANRAEAERLGLTLARPPAVPPASPEATPPQPPAPPAS